MHRPFSVLSLVFLAACHAPSTSPGAAPGAPSRGRPAEIGILVMAHGGGPDWDLAVAEALEPLRATVPTALAFGMAEAGTVAAGLDSLAARGVRRVAVVRLFLSGRSFRGETRALLGLDEPVVGHHGHLLPPIDHGLWVATHERGLLDSERTTEVLVERTLSRSRMPEHESLLLVAHGMGDDDDDAAVLRAMDEAVATLRPRGFARVERVTLREDWPEKRVEAEERMRSFVLAETHAGRSVIVVPVRLFGFGPYADVLDGLDYASTDALLPHPLIAQWILETAEAVACAEGWPTLTTPCPA